VDDHTLEVTLAQPLPYFPQMTVHYTFMPSHRGTVEAHGNDWTKPENIVSNGAYTLTEMAINEYLRMAANPGQSAIRSFCNALRTCVRRSTSAMRFRSRCSVDLFARLDLWAVFQVKVRILRAVQSRRPNGSPSA
jgi:hypothetical protein